MNRDGHYTYVIFGSSSFDSLPHRGKALALEMATRGARVDYIEFPPSLLGTIRSRLEFKRSINANESAGSHTKYPPSLRLLIPPMAPVSVRNNIVPGLDKRRFQQWFHKMYPSMDWKKTIVWIMMPLWWKWYVDDATFDPHMIIYDIADDVSVYSSSPYSLWRLKRSEMELASHIQLVTYSASQMRIDIETNFPGVRSQYLPNAMSAPFKQLAEMSPHVPVKADTTLGFVGIVNNKWIDVGLLKKVAEVFPTHVVDIIGPIDSRIAHQFKSFTNVRLAGLLSHDVISEQILNFNVALIPFHNNTITRVVNPLKLYEYSSAGVPIVAMYTAELEQYRDLIYLCSSHDEFIANIKRALLEKDVALKLKRKQFALQNTWMKRVADFERMLAVATT